MVAIEELQEQRENHMRMIGKIEKQIASIIRQDELRGKHTFTIEMIIRTDEAEVSWVDDIHMFSIKLDYSTIPFPPSKLRELIEGKPITI